MAVKKNKASTKKSLVVRMMIIVSVITFVFFGVTSMHMFQIMILDGDFYKEKAAAQQLQDTVLDAKRGDIYDKNMEVIATSATAYNVYVTPSDIKTDEERQIIASGLSEILGLEYENVLEKIKTNQYYVKIQSKIEEQVATKVRKFISENELGSIVGLDETSKRYYPNENMASNVIGFVGTDNQGLAGIESYYNDILSGVPGRVVATKNAQGADTPLSYEKVVDAQSGNSLVLSIDKYVQNVTEKYLSQAIEENKVVNKGCAIVMDPNTGEILAMSTMPDYNLNDPFTIADESVKKEIEKLESEEKSTAISNAQQAQWRNKAISDTYEPGSVFKIVTGSAALEEGTVALNSSFSCPGYIVVADRKYSCSHTDGHGTQNLTQAFANSCNPAFIKIGQDLGVEKFYSYFESFGLTQKTGIDLPGETSPVAGVTYHAGDTMSIVDLASESFGQGFNVTPIQMITAVCAAVNGGYLVQPKVVNKIINSEGNIVESKDTVVKRQIISENTSKTICSLLEGVVTYGTGKNAYVTGYSVGGKTGTSEKLSSGEGCYVASFCGFSSVENPQVVVLVMLDTPTGGNYYGGTIAAPVVGQILSDILPYIGAQTEYSDETEKQKTSPNTIGNKVDDAINTITNMGLSYKVYGDGEEVERQVPSPGQSIDDEGVVVLYTDSSKSNMVTVPDFSGETVSNANEIAASYNLNIKFSGNSLQKGNSVAYAQSIEPGEKVEEGTIITVYFKVLNGTD